MTINSICDCKFTTWAGWYYSWFNPTIQSTHNKATYLRWHVLHVETILIHMVVWDTWPKCGHLQLYRHSFPIARHWSTWELSCPLGNRESQILVISNVRFKVIEMQYLHKLLMKKLPKSSSFANSMNTYPSQTHDGVHLEHMVQSHRDMCFWCPFFATNLTIYHSSIGVQFIKSHNRRPT